MRSDANIITGDESDASVASGVGGNDSQVALRRKKLSYIQGTRFVINKCFPVKTYSRLKQTLIRMKTRKFFVQECVICIEPIRNDCKCRMLSCFHIFHAECIENWLVTNASCPMCNKQLTKSTDIKLDYKDHQMNSISVDNECFFSDHIVIRKPDLLNISEFRRAILCALPHER